MRRDVLSFSRQRSWPDATQSRNVSCDFCRHTCGV